MLKSRDEYLGKHVLGMWVGNAAACEGSTSTIDFLARFLALREFVLHQSLRHLVRFRMRPFP